MFVPWLCSSQSVCRGFLSGCLVASLSGVFSILVCILMFSGRVSFCFWEVYVFVFVAGLYSFWGEERGTCCLFVVSGCACFRRRVVCLFSIRFLLYLAIAPMKIWGYKPYVPSQSDFCSVSHSEDAIYATGLAFRTLVCDFVDRNRVLIA